MTFGFGSEVVKRTVPVYPVSALPVSVLAVTVQDV